MQGMRKMRWLHDRLPKIGANIAPLVACVVLLLAPSSLNAQSIPPIPTIPPIATIPPIPTIPPILANAPIPAIAPLVESLGLSDTILQGLNTVCSGSLQSEGCTAALGRTLTEALENVPPESLGNVFSELIAPVISALELPGDVAVAVGSTCSSLPLSTECANLLNAVAQQVSTSQQVVTNMLASTTLQTTQQITDFALSGAVFDSPFLTPVSPAVVRSVAPTVATFGISGVSHTSHDGFEVRSPGGGAGRSVEFDSLDAGITLGVRFDASRAVNWSKDTLTIGLFGNYTNSDIDLDSNRILRDVGITRAGDASLNSGSGGGYAVLTNGRAYGLVLGSGEFGNASAKDALLNSHADFDVSGFSSSAATGLVLQTGPRTKVDLRGGLNYLNSTADKHTDSVGIAFGEGELDEFSGTLSARLFGAWAHGNTVVRPFLQGGVDYRFHYQNEIVVENVKFEFDEGPTTLFGRVGMDFDVGDYVQVLFGFPRRS